MNKLDAEAPEARSADAIAENLARLAELFPEAFTEGKVDFDVLRQLLGDAVNDGDERYGLNWHGKRQARRLALVPSTGTLRPAPAESVDWDNTQNLMIEGDNLEVLKLLQKSYAGKVKLIYIDPPYNTGKDVLYRDNYTDPLADYRRSTGQADAAGRRLKSNPESSGRFHTQWLNMLYPRLHLARSLLAIDGAIFISIDEKELPNLRLMLDDVFGQENLVSTFTILCNPRGRAQDKHFATTHEYIVCYSRTPLGKGSFGVPKDAEQIAEEYGESDSSGRYRHLELRNTHREFGRHNRPNLYYPLFAADDGTVSVEPGEGRVAVYPDWDDGYEGCWTWGRPKAKAEANDLVAREVRGRLKVFVKDRADNATRMLKTLFLDKSYATDKGQRAFNELFETKEKIFPSPKSPHLLAELIATHSEDGDIVLDFFAGSGTCAHAAMQQNAKDQKKRRFLAVQIDEATGRSDFPSIAEIAKERSRRAGREVQNAQGDPKADVGFRVFKLDTSNIRPWNSATSDLDGDLLAAVDHIEPHRTEQDILYELLLKLGLDLCAPIETRVIGGSRVHAVGPGTLFACLEEKEVGDEYEALAAGVADWHDEFEGQTETTVVFRDSVFANDVTKANVATILEQRGLSDVRSL